MNAKEISIEGLKLKVLIYGKSGTGKTTFASTFPKPYVFDFDGGMLSQRSKDVDFDTYDTWNGVLSKLEELEREKKYETLVLDSVTTMQEYMMKQILTLTRKPRGTQYEWGILVLDLKDLFLRLSKMAPNIVITAHEIILQDEITTEIIVQPLVYGKKTPGQMPLWFDEIYRMQVGRTKEGKPEYQMLTTADVKYTAKSRLGVLEPVTVWSKDGKAMNAYDIIMGKVKGG